MIVDHGRLVLLAELHLVLPQLLVRQEDVFDHRDGGDQPVACLG